MDIDSDNFDFKPITEGLGFDKKAEEKKMQRPASLSPSFVEEEVAPVKAPILEKPIDWNTNPPKTSRAITELISALPPSIDFDDKKSKMPESKVYKPVGRLEYSVPTPPMPEIAPAPLVPKTVTDPKTGQSVDVTLNNTLEKAFPKAGFRRPFFHQTVEVKPQYTPITTSFTSAVLDALVITGLTALFLVCLILITKIDLIAVILHTQAPLSVWGELGAIFCGVYLLYYMCTRGFWGATLGDWAFDMQLGLEADRMNWYYPAQVVGRMVLIAATGFIVIPLLSFILRRDLAYHLSGLRLYQRNY